MFSLTRNFGKSHHNEVLKKIKNTSAGILVSLFCFLYIQNDCFSRNFSKICGFKAFTPPVLGAKSAARRPPPLQCPSVLLEGRDVKGCDCQARSGGVRGVNRGLEVPIWGKATPRKSTLKAKIGCSVG